MKILTNLSAEEQMSFNVETDANDAGKGEHSKTSHIRKLSSIKLFEAAKEVMIEHDREIYFLRLTRQNKLILTK